MAEKRKPMFALQWHLTTACPNHCKHCYMERNNRILSLGACKMIVDDLKSLMERWNCRGRIHFTGGDPLLYPWFFDLLVYARFQIPDLTMDVMGNPELLTEEVAERLGIQQVFSYQMSIDGMEQTHDYLRYPGNFKATWSKLSVLQKYGIKTTIMTTVSNLNLSEIPQIADMVVEHEVDFFDFRRFVPIGRGKEMEREALIPPHEFKDLLQAMDAKHQEWKGRKTYFTKGDPLWALFYFEKGDLLIRDDEDLLCGGCIIGSRTLTILEDGTTLACRRLQIPVGKVPEQRLRDIFIVSDELNRLRKFEEIEKCNGCELFPYCRGCRAAAYAVTGNYFAPDPQCWK